MERLVEYRDWKYYCALMAAITFAGASSYLLSSISSSSRTSAKKENVDSQDAADDEGMFLQDSKRNTETVKENAASTRNPQEVAEELKAKGNDKFREGEYPEAIDLYTKALHIREDPAYYSNRAACYYKQRAMDLVIEDCNKALEIDPKYTKAFTRRAQAQEKQDKLSEALYDFMYACSLSNSNKTATDAVQRLLNTISENKAKTMMNSAPKLPSSTCIDHYFQSFPSQESELAPTNVGDATGDAWFAKAWQATQVKDYQTALDASKEALRLGCKTYQAEALILTGTYMYLADVIDEALECFKKAVQINPRSVLGYVKLSNIYRKQHKNAYANQQLEQALAINPHVADVYYHRGRANEEDKKYSEAANDYQECIALDNAFVYAHIHLGLVLHKQGQTTKAEDTFREALQQFPTSLEVYSSYGQCLAEQGRYEEAGAMLDQAIRIDASHPGPLIYKAEMMLRLGNREAAKELYTQALAVEPTYELAVSLAGILKEEQNLEASLVHYEKAIHLARTQAELQEAIREHEKYRTQCQIQKHFS